MGSGQDDVSDRDDVVDATRVMVETVEDTRRTLAGDLPLFERVVQGPSTCVDPPDTDRFQGSVRVGIVLPAATDLDVLLGEVRDKWEERGLDTEVHAEQDLPRVQARDDDRGTGYAAEGSRETHTLTLLASTACLPLPEEHEHVRDLRPRFLDLVDPDGETVEEQGRTRQEAVDAIREREGLD